MRNTFAIILIICSLPIFSQIINGSQNELISSNNKDQAWVEEMIAQIEKNLSSDPKTALEYSEYLCAEVEKKTDNDNIYKANHYRAIALRILGEYAEAKKYIRLAQKNIPPSNSEYQIAALTSLGTIYYESSEYDSALLTYDLAEKLIQKDPENALILDILNNRANVYSLRGNYELAIENYLRSEQIYAENKDLISLSNVYNSLGTENRNLKNYQKSIKYYQQAAEINKAHNNLLDLARNYSNMGVSYNGMDSVDLALEYYQKSLAIAEKLGTKLIIAQNNVNIANIYEKKGDYKNALIFFNNSLNICKQENITYGLMLNYLNIGNTNYLKGDYPLAIASLDSSYKYINQLELPKEKAQIFERYSRIYIAMGDYQKAFHYQELFKQINDSLITIEKHQQIVELQTKFETAEKERTILQLKTNEVKQKLAIVYLTILAILLVILILWVNDRRKQNLKEKKRADELAILHQELILTNATKDKFFSIIAHDLKTPFNSIVGFSTILNDKMRKKDYQGVEKYAGIIENSSNQAMELLMNLMEWSQSQTGRMTFNPEEMEMNSLIQETLLLFGDIAAQKSISIENNLSDYAPVQADKAMISTVLRNLISNAIKFTHPGGEIIILTKKHHEKLRVSISDNGVGISKANLQKIFRIDESTTTSGTLKEKGTGLGLILCKEFIAKHQGNIWIESEEDKGSSIYFTLPLNLETKK